MKTEKLEEQLKKIEKCGMDEHFLINVEFLTHSKRAYERVNEIEKLIDSGTVHTISFDVFYEDMSGQPVSEIDTYHYTFDGEKYNESSTPKGVVFTIACGLS